MQLLHKTTKTLIKEVLSEMYLFPIIFSTIEMCFHIFNLTLLHTPNEGPFTGSERFRMTHFSITTPTECLYNQDIIFV